MPKKTKNPPELVNADDTSSFWVNNGPVLKNIPDLKNALLGMSEDTFKYHVNKEKNDFADWVRDILKDNVLANKLAKTKTLKSTIKAVEERLKKYNAL